MLKTYVKKSNETRKEKKRSIAVQNKLTSLKRGRLIRIYRYTQVSDTNFTSLDYLLNIKAREVMRTDTIYKVRTDTLNISTVRSIIKPNPFYNTFWFGSALTSLVIILILLIK